MYRCLLLLVLSLAVPATAWADQTPLITSTGHVFTPASHQSLGSGFRDDTGLTWYIQTRPDGAVIDDADFAQAQYHCQLRGGTVPPYAEMDRFRSYFGTGRTRDAIVDYQVPPWFYGLADHRFWTSTPNRSGLGRYGVPFDDMFLLDGSKSWLISDNLASSASIICVSLI